MSDPVQTDLAVPDIDWNNYSSGGTFKVPPQAKDASGNVIQYFVQAPPSFKEEDFGRTQAGFLKVKLDPLTFVNNGDGVDGYQIRFQTISAKQYSNRDGKAINASQLGNYLMAAQTGLQPKTVDEYKSAINATAAKLLPVTIEWEVYDKTTQQTVRSKYDDFDGLPGSKSPVIKTDDGRTLVARAKVKNFVVPARA